MGSDNVGVPYKRVVTRPARQSRLEWTTPAGGQRWNMEAGALPGRLHAMKTPMYGTFPIVYPAAAAYFDCETTCSLKDERCGGPVKVHAYFYFEDAPLPGPDGELVMEEFPTAVELMLADGLDYIELCSVHHGEWWQMQRQEYVKRAEALAETDRG